jgi:hypothetical protein
VRRAYGWGQRNVATVALVSLGLGVVLTGLLAFSFYRAHDTERRVTKVEHSPCTEHPAGTRCQDIKARSDEKRPVSSACILFYKVDRNGQLLKLTKCPVEPRAQRKIEAAESWQTNGGTTALVPHSESVDGGDAESAGNPGHSQPGPHGSGGSGNGGSGGAPVPGQHGSGGAAVPPATSPAAPSPSQPSSSPPDAPPVDETAPEVPRGGGVGQVLGGVGRVVEEPGTTVEETVGGVSEVVHETQCSLGLGKQC